MTDLPPRRKPFLIMAPEDRIGTPHIPIDPEKIVAIVESDYPDQTQANAPEDDTSRSAIPSERTNELYTCLFSVPSLELVQWLSIVSPLLKSLNMPHVMDSSNAEPLFTLNEIPHFHSQHQYVT